jgi:hypothetical protein
LLRRRAELEAALSRSRRGAADLVEEQMGFDRESGAFCVSADRVLDECLLPPPPSSEHLPGVRGGQLAELVGLSGSGKTQWCLQAAAGAAAAGRGVLFITRGEFLAGRLFDMVRALLRGQVDDPATDAAARAALARIRVVAIRDAFDLIEALYSAVGCCRDAAAPSMEELSRLDADALPAASGPGAAAPLFSWNAFGLIIVDGLGDVLGPLMAEPFWRDKRLDKNTPQLSGRALQLHAQRALRCLTNEFGLAAIVTNRASRVKQHQYGSSPLLERGPSSSKTGQKPMLGRIWGFAADVRILLVPPSRNLRRSDSEWDAPTDTFNALLLTTPPLSTTRFRVVPFGISDRGVIGELDGKK